jgi:heat shock protein HslJ
MPNAPKACALSLALLMPAAALAGPFGDWQVAEVAGQARAEGTTIAFAPDGRVSGQAGCNRYFGSYALEGGLTLSPLGATRMACPEPIMAEENAFLDAIGRVTGYAMGVDGGAEVLFLLSDGAILLRAQR